MRFCDATRGSLLDDRSYPPRHHVDAPRGALAPGWHPHHQRSGLHLHEQHQHDLLGRDHDGPCRRALEAT